MSVKSKELKDGIAEYKYEQSLLIRFLRRYGPITEYQFDDIFSGTKKVIDKSSGKTIIFPKIRKARFLGCSGNTFVLGGLYGGNRDRWLELAQIMCTIGLIDIYKDGVIKYDVSEDKKE